MPGIIDDAVSWAELDHTAVVHHSDAVADHAGDREVVGDEDDRDAQLDAQLIDQLEHLSGDRHIQGGGRLVAEEHLGRDDGGTGQNHSLPLTA